MGTVKHEKSGAGRTVVYCIGETGAKVMDRAAPKLDDLPNNEEWFCIRCGPFGMGSVEMIRRDLKDKEYLLLLFDLRDGYDGMCNGAGNQCFYFAVDIAGFIAVTAREQGLKVFSAVAEGDIMGGGITRQYLHESLWSVGEDSDCILTLPYTKEQPPEELLWQASQLLLSLPDLDLADVRELFPNGGIAYLGAGHADGAQPARAAEELLSSREFTEQLKQAGGLFIHFSCPEAGADLDLIEQTVRSIQNTAPPDADIIWNARLEEAPQAETHLILLAADPRNKVLKKRRAEERKRKELEREKFDNRRPGHLYPNSVSRKKVIKYLWQTIENALHARYGMRPDVLVARRVREEWAAMERCKDIETVAALYEFTQWLKSKRAPCWMAGTAGSSLILYLLDVTRANPLPPHYMYPCCKHILWHPAAADGFDLPTVVCPKDGSSLHGDGHKIPWQVHWGPEGWDERAHYYLHLPKALKERVQAFWAGHWLDRLQPAAASFSMRRDGSGCDSLHFSRFCLVFDLEPNKPRPDCCRTVPGTALHRRTVLFSERLAHFGMHPFAEAPCGPEPEKPDRFIYRDDVFLCLWDQGFSEKDAWRAMRSAMMGKSLPFDIAESAPSLDRQTLAQMEKARYLFPKAHAVEYLLFCRRAGKWS